MMKSLVAFALHMPLIVYALAAMLVVLGFYSYRQLDIEAYPNPCPPLVEIITQPQGWSPEEVEKFVTIPLEIGMAGMPGLLHTRSQSLFGLSDIKCYFQWGTDYAAARQEVINRLGFIQLPPGIQAQISPWNAIGEVFRYTLEGAGYSLQELKTAQDWILERQFKQVPGVIDVVSFGGDTKEYQVLVNPFRLGFYGITLAQASLALQNGNQNAGGQRLAIGEQSYDIRGVGLISKPSDIEEIVIGAQKGVPVRIRDVAEVRIGSAPRLGIVGKDNRPDVVQGIVLMRYGGQTQPTLEGLHQRLFDIRKNHLLPPGMEIIPYYDRGDLVKLTTHTVLENVVVGIALVGAVLFVFLGHARAAFITTLTIPLSLLAAFCGLVFSQTSANLLSLGAIDFGIVVDSTVIMVENIFRHLGPQDSGTMAERIGKAAGEVAGPMTFAALIIGISFLPLFTLTGVSGVIFAPMARTYAYAIGSAILLALLLTPVLIRRLISQNTKDHDSRIVLAIDRLYKPLLAQVLARPRIAVIAGGGFILLAAALFPLLGREFMPKLEEGNLWIRATLPMSISLAQSQKYVGRMRDIVRGCTDQACTESTRRHSEVRSVVSQVGRPDDGTDVSGFFNIELFAPLRPFSEWKHKQTKQQLTEELAAELRRAFPGVVFNFSQMISDNVEEAVAGVKGENSIKVFGPDIATNEELGQKIIDLLNQVSGIADLGLLHSQGQPSVRITPDRQACARYNLNTGDVINVIATAIGGQAVTHIREDERVFDLTVRFQEAFRKSVEDIREIAVSTPSGIMVLLGQIAMVELVQGPATIYREDGQRYTPIKFSVRGRDLGTTVAQAQGAISAKVHLPYDVHLSWSGELNELRDAQTRLFMIIPLTLLAIAFLVYSAVRSGIDTIVVLLNIPVSCAGGIVALYLFRISFSVSAAMGFISIFGIAIQDALLVVTYFQRLRADGRPLKIAVQQAAEKRLRPALMTTLVATLGLLPAALATGIGSQTQKPLAIVVIGGSLTLALLSRVLQPPLLLLAHRLGSTQRPQKNPCEVEDAR